MFKFKKINKMDKVWIINQFANTNDMPGHTRQYDLSLYLKNKGLSVSVFSSDFNLALRKYLKRKNNFLYGKETINGVHWYWLKVLGYKRNNWKRYLNIISFDINLLICMFLKCFLGIFLNSKPSLIIASSPQLPAAFFSFLIAKLFGIPFILEVRDLWPRVLLDIKNYKTKSFYIKLLFFMENVLYKHSNLVVVLSKGCIPYVKSRGAKEVIYLPNGPDLRIFKYADLPEESDSFSKERPFKIVYSGAHGLVNGLKNVIDAARLLYDLPIKFYLIGDGQEKDNLIKYASDINSIIFKDPISHGEMPEFLSKFDAILVSLSDIKLFRYGVSPNKLYDAYALGRPVITTIPGIINDEVIKYNVGVTSKAESPVDLAMSIKSLFKLTREDRKKMSINSRMLAEKNYSRNIICQKYYQIIKNNIY